MAFTIFLAQDVLGVGQGLEYGIAGIALILLGFALRTLYQMVMSDKKELTITARAAERRDELEKKLLNLVERSIVSSERATNAYERTTTAYEQSVGIIKDNCEAIKSLSATLAGFKQALDANTQKIEELVGEKAVIFQPFADQVEALKTQLDRYCSSSVEIVDADGNIVAEVLVTSPDNGEGKIKLVVNKKEM